MINPKNLINQFQNCDFYCGVPDSTLKNFTNLIDKKKNYICANEGAAIATGIGYYLSSKKLPVIYMQNSGLSNALNPLLSVAHKKVYSIPLLLVIGWRGSPNVKDEPQHIVKGEITEKLLLISGIRHLTLNKQRDIYKIKDLIRYAKKNQKPVAILIKNQSLKKIKEENKKKLKTPFYRHDFLKEFLAQINKNTLLVSNTGYCSREINHILKTYKNNFIKPFFMIGGMGHTSSITQGLFLGKIKKKTDIICIDGDGSMIMHLGALITANKFSNKFKYILLNNYSHESVGGQTTNIENIDLKKMSNTLNFNEYIFLNNKKKLLEKIKFFLKFRKSIFFEVQVDTGTLRNLSRPKDFLKIKRNFMK